MTTNNLSEPVGQHWTLTRVVMDEKGDFAFCVSDDGVAGFISRPVVKKMKINPGMEGAGFRAPCRAPSGENLGDGSPAITYPVIFDADNTMQELRSRLEGEPFDTVIEDLMDQLLHCRNVLTVIRDDLKASRKWVDERS